MALLALCPSLPSSATAQLPSSRDSPAVQTPAVQTPAVQTPAVQTPGAAGVAGRSESVAVLKKGSALLLDVAKTAATFGWKAKLVSPGKLLVLCRAEDESFCVPIRLADVPWQQKEDVLYVQADVIGQALGFEVLRQQDVLTLRPLEGQQPAGNREPGRLQQEAVQSYNEAWGRNRGFRVGETLPDIPLYDMQGREVRFSAFLGKRYIIYCWASW